MLSLRPHRDEAGSGMAIGVAITFPMLMLVIVVLQTMAGVSRMEQTLQATANRAARSAALCCYFIDGTDGAEAAVEASLAAAADENAFNQVFCNNDLVGDSRTVFIDVANQPVTIDPYNPVSLPVPPGGTVHVFLTCRIPPEHLGGFALRGLGIDRKVVGTATIDPYRFRSGA